MDGQRIVDLAKTYVGTPWKHQGRGRTGLDCVGLVYRVWCDLGLDPSVDGTGYGHVSDGRWLRRVIDGLLIRVDGPRLGGVLLMAQRGSHPLHLGVITQIGDQGSVGSIVHANARVRQVIEQDFVPALGLRPVAYYQYPEVRGQMTEGKGQRPEDKGRKGQHVPSDLCLLTSDI